jgi:hypothetical protein
MKAMRLSTPKKRPPSADLAAVAPELRTICARGGTDGKISQSKLIKVLTVLAPSLSLDQIAKRTRAFVDTTGSVDY